MKTFLKILAYHTINAGGRNGWGTRFIDPSRIDEITPMFDLADRDAEGKAIVDKNNKHVYVPGVALIIYETRDKNGVAYQVPGTAGEWAKRIADAANGEPETDPDPDPDPKPEA